MHERPLYENTFNHAFIVNRRYRRMALASFIISLGLLGFYLLQ
ncbi:MAG: hypothetical protein WBP05_17875 [Nitrospira sp.]